MPHPLVSSVRSLALTLTCGITVFATVPFLAAQNQNVAYPAITGGQNILTIGNSLSLSGNAIPGMLDHAMEQSGVPSLTAGLGGWGRLSAWASTLATHQHLNTSPLAYNNTPDQTTGSVQKTWGGYTNILSGMSVGGVPTGTAWNYVLLQSWSGDNAIYGSTLPLATDEISNASEFFKQTRRFVQVVRKAGAVPVLFGRQARYNSNLASYKALTDQITANYRAIGKELGAIVVPFAEIYYQGRVQRLAGQAEDYLFSDAVHPTDTGHGLYAYTFYSVLAQRSPIGVPIVTSSNSVSRYSENVEGVGGVDANLEQIVWQVIQQEMPWAQPGYVAPTPNGNVTATYSPATGAVSITITGSIRTVTLGTPGKNLMTSANVSVSSLSPVQTDSELISWTSSNNTSLPPGTYSLGVVATPGTAIADMFLTYTTINGVGATGTINSLATPQIVVVTPSSSNGTATTGVNTTIDTTVTDDGPLGNVTYSWTKISGPGTATFSAPTANDSSVSFSQAGSYVVQLSANDGTNTGTANISFTVTNPSLGEIDLSRGSAITQGGTDSVTFSNIALQDFTLVYTITNSGNAALTVGTPTFSLANNCSAILTANPAASVSANSSTTFNVDITPTTGGAWSIQISIPNNDSNESPAVFTVSGNATSAYAGWTASINWGAASNAASADPDGDSLNNLTEYALGGNPLVPDQNLIPTISIDAQVGQPALALTYTRIADPALLYEVIGSIDFVVWGTISSSTGAANVAGQTTVVDGDFPIATTPKRFLRLRVTQP